MANWISNFFSDYGLAMQGKDPQEQRMKIERMKSLMESEEGQRLLRSSQEKLNIARAESLNRGEGLYGGRGVDPYVKGSEDLGKIRAARDKFLDEGDELTPETAAYFDAAEKSVLDRMKSAPTRDNRNYFAPGDETDVFEALGKKKKYEAPTGVDPIDRAIGAAGGRKTLPKAKKFGERSVFEELADYFQAPTETVPEGNVPKTYPQMGIESVDDQATLEEMQKALPSVDMKDEYESDPEMMQKLMQLWKEGKLNKQNLHKAFSEIQQTAQQALGIR